jgi:hypothetical protein
MQKGRFTGEHRENGEVQPSAFAEMLRRDGRVIVFRAIVLHGVSLVLNCLF